jgi:alanine dehydrogenase
MKIGVVKEIKQDEYRVAVVPAGVEEFVKDGHKVYVEDGAGLGSGITNEQYIRSGAEILKTKADVYDVSEMVIKVKEPIKEEFDMIKKDQIIFCFFHFAADRNLALAMVKTNAVCIAYETVEKDDGTLPLLTPMSEIAGRLAIFEGAKFLQKPMEGKGILLSGVPGVSPARVVIIGGGVVGSNAAKVAAGIGAHVTVLDINLDRLRYLSEIMPPNVVTIYSNPYNIREAISQADLVVGAVLISGAKAPVLIEKKDLKLMQPGSVIVDVAIDQGGCVETARPTTHSAPTYIVDGIIHYCVTNMPGAVGATSTYALANATISYSRKIAAGGWINICKKDQGVAKGVNIARGVVTHRAVASSLDLEYAPLERLVR